MGCEMQMTTEEANDEASYESNYESNYEANYEACANRSSVALTWPRSRRRGPRRSCG
jgi:hypothetical protein